jgi:Type I phosphodiesterase / nucleotide pyrophosphatase
MSWSRLRPVLLAAFALLPLLWQRPAPAVEAPQRPRLVVLVLFDQLRGDYLTRWRDLFVADGFRRLLTDGAWFPNCHYPYANTVTGAGHASVLTGCSPDRHGIVGNDWYDRAAGETVYCATLPRYETVPAPPNRTGTTAKKAGGGAPDRLLAPSLADVLKEATGGQGVVVSLSLKDRGAVFTAGRRPDACYWFDTARGLFVTSTYYRDQPHAWVAALNRERFADRWFGRPWVRLDPSLDYAPYSGPDDVAGEGKGYDQGRTFPHPMTGGLKKPGKNYYEALYNSPFGNNLLLELVKRAVDAEKLGADDVPDLLSVSFSSTDPVGHNWGPDSQEVLDSTLRADRVVQDLLAYLDARVGKGRYVLVLTADHGICPLPELSRARGLAAARVPLPSRKDAEAFLSTTFAAPDGTRWVEAVAESWFYLNRAVLRERGLASATVEAALAGWLKEQPGILAVYTRTQLEAGVPADDVLGQHVRRSFHPERCGDLMVVLKPYYLFSGDPGTGTAHGTPHAYDTHVPLVAYGGGIRPGVFSEAVTPQAAAAILAHRLGVKRPARAEAPLPEGLRP